MAPIAKSAILPQPSQFQLALALAIAKSKPAQLSIRDYLHKIRTHILNGSREKNYASDDEYFDAAAHWHDMFKESQLKIQELQNKMLKLETVNDKLREESRTSELLDMAMKDNTTDVAAAAKTPLELKNLTAAKKGAKRKQDQIKASASSRSTKKVGTKSDQQPTVLQSTDTLIEDLGVFDSPGAGSTTVLHLYRAHKLYQQIGPSTSDLAYHLSQAASNLADHISIIAKQIQQHVLDASATHDKHIRAQPTSCATSQTDAEFTRILRAAGRSFMSLFHGLTTIWDKGTDAARKHHGATTYAYIQTISVLLDAISANCVLVAQINIRQSVTESSSTIPSSKKTKQVKLQKTNCGNKPIIAQELVSLLLALFTHLTPARQGAHTALFEGILYILLERTAKRLFHLTFDHERRPTIERDIEETDADTSSQITAIEHHAISIEVKFLVNLLERAITLAPSFLGSLSGSETKPTRPAKSTSKRNTIAKGGASLSISAKEKLQRTLVECMFGPASARKSSASHEGDTEDEDPHEQERNNEFIEVLKKPVEMAVLPPTPRIDEGDVPEWFTGEVWRLIGWDVLGWEGDW